MYLGTYIIYYGTYISWSNYSCVYAQSKRFKTPSIIPAHRNLSCSWSCTIRSQKRTYEQPIACLRKQCLLNLLSIGNVYVLSFLWVDVSANHIHANAQTKPFRTIWMQVFQRIRAPKRLTHMSSFLESSTRNMLCANTNFGHYTHDGRIAQHIRCHYRTHLYSIVWWTVCGERKDWGGGDHSLGVGWRR